jgi:hypothetical protein
MVGGAESSDGDLTQNRGNYDGLIVKVAQDGTIVWQKATEVQIMSVSFPS